MSPLSAQTNGRRTPRNITGIWQGWSVYVPVDGFFFEDREAIYRIEAEFGQRGQRLTMRERITRIYSIDGRPLDQIPTREITGSGRFSSDVDAIVTFSSKDVSFSGTMYLALDATSNELYGILVVRPRHNARPVAVKLLLRRADDTLPTLEDLGIDRIRRLSESDDLQ
jgi:hypothetical protein